MNRPARFFLALGASLAASAGWTADNSSETIAAGLRDRAMRGDSVAWDFVSELTTRIGPRPAGSAAEHAAAEWSAKKLRSLGFENVRIESFPMTAWVRGTERVEITSPSPQPVVAAALGGSPPTPANGIEAEVVLFATFDDLKAAAPASLNGKIAMISRPMPATQDGSGYAATSAARRDGPNEAAHRGAIDFVLRSLATGGNRFAHAGAARYDGTRFLIPSFALSEPDAEQIVRLTQLGAKVRLKLSSTASYVPNATSQNVVGEIRGSGRPNETLVLGAHLDSWDLGTGAIDDAAGLAIITGAARLIAEAPRKPRRTVRVVFYGSEEVTQPGTVSLGADSYPRYFDVHHSADDTLDKIDRAALSQNVAAWASLVWLAADSDVDFRALAKSSATGATSH